MNVIAIAFENVVLLEADFDVQITWRATVGAWLAVAGATNAHAAVDATRDLDFQCLLFLDLALAMAGNAGLRDDLADATASRAGLLHAEKPLAHLHRAGAATSAAGLGLRARLGAAALAGVATFPTGDTNLGVLATGSFF